MKQSRFGIVLAVVLSFAWVGQVEAQTPPDISRWSGSTALSQAQGYDMGDPLHLTWGFVNDGTFIPNAGSGTGAGANSNFHARFTSIYGSQAAYQAVFQQTFDRWASISGLEYTFEANDDGATFVNTPGASGVRADIRIGGRNIDGNNGVLAYNYFPNSGDMVIDTNDNFFNNTSNNSLATRNVVAHEHGHGLGMEHIWPVNFQFLMEPFTTSNPSFDGPQYHDILVAQRGYGDFNEKSFNQQGNDVFQRATGLGTINDGQTVSRGDDARDLFVNPTETDFFSIDDQTDIDFWSFEVAQLSTVDILLESLGQTYDIGGSSSSTGPFDTSRRSDLALDLYDTDGMTLLASSDVTGLGGIESLAGVALNAAGTYYIRISGTDNPDSIAIDTQFYGLSVTVHAAAIPEPAAFGFVLLVGTACLTRRRRRS